MGMLVYTISATESLGRIKYLTILRVSNMGLVQDNYECGGGDNLSDEISFTYESGGGSSEILTSQEFYASTSIGVNRRMMCIDTATMYLNEED